MFDDLWPACFVCDFKLKLFFFNSRYEALLLVESQQSNSSFATADETFYFIQQYYPIHKNAWIKLKNVKVE